MHLWWRWGIRTIGFSLFLWHSLLAIGTRELQELAPLNQDYLKDPMVLPGMEKWHRQKETAKNTPYSPEDRKDEERAREERRPPLKIHIPPWPQLLVVAGIILLFILYRLRHRQAKQRRR
ncbi:MAG: hypothetical protein NZM25_04625 [Leptospiraceae bacterium]|nr:hypothetical protein [Leptospiraceae bacterium]MDW8305702.1 hypothetical protein [Leptospiraceae bacterium]